LCVSEAASRTAGTAPQRRTLSSGHHLLTLLSIQDLPQLRVDLCLQSGDLLTLETAQLQLVLQETRHDLAGSRLTTLAGIPLTERIAKSSR
jgi:hypothetical protein